MKVRIKARITNANFKDKPRLFKILTQRNCIILIPRRQALRSKTTKVSIYAMLCISDSMTITQSFITNSLTSEDMFIELIRFCVLLNFDSHLAKLNRVCRWCSGYQMEKKSACKIQVLSECFHFPLIFLGKKACIY